MSHGVLFPKFRGDLVQTAVVTERMRAGAIEALHLPANPLDVLAQQVVAMCALDDWTVGDIHDLVRRAAPYATLTRPLLESVLDMLSGKYPSDEFAELRPRVTWDRLSDTVIGRRGAQRLAVTSGGTIPDRGLYAVFLATGDGPGRRESVRHAAKPASSTNRSASRTCCTRSYPTTLRGNSPSSQPSDACPASELT